MQTLISVLAWVESTALSQWVIGAPYAFPTILTLHALGMGAAAGLSVMVDLRVLGIARGVPLAELQRFLPTLWAGFGLNLVSGVLLLIGYPTKALTNPVFFLKIGLIVVALVLLTRIAKRAFAHDALGGKHDNDARRTDEDEARGPDDDAAHAPLRRLAIVSLACWIGAIFAGRLLAYTYWYLTAADY